MFNVRGKRPVVLFDNANIQTLFLIPKIFLFIFHENNKKIFFWFKTALFYANFRFKAFSGAICIIYPDVNLKAVRCKIKRQKQKSRAKPGLSMKTILYNYIYVFDAKIIIFLFQHIQPRLFLCGDFCRQYQFPGS